MRYAPNSPFFSNFALKNCETRETYRFDMKKEQKTLILISNDDGYHAGGIRYLCEMLRDDYDVLVVAPESARSGFSGAFSATTPLRLKRRHTIEGVSLWSCNGTPVDCIKLALAGLCHPDEVPTIDLGFHRLPDLILSGINHGDNSTVNEHYSGTMGAAMEGCMKYLPSVAFSSCNYDTEADLSYLSAYVRPIVEKVLKEGLPKGTCLNVNFPKEPPFKGVKFCRMTMGSWVNEVVEERHPRGYPYYWMVGHYRNDEPESTDTDQWALTHGYVAITPTTMDVTDYRFLEKMRGEESSNEEGND